MKDGFSVCVVLAPILFSMTLEPWVRNSLSTCISLAQEP